MKDRLYLYSLLVIFLSVQVVLMKRTAWVPDLVLLTVVFTGIFRGWGEGAVFGLAAGFLRGCFSVGTPGLDILLFPAVGAVSSVLPAMFYRQNPAAQVFAATAVVFTVVAAHTLYLNATCGNDIGIFFALKNSWKCLALTVAVSPLVFVCLERLLRVESE